VERETLAVLRELRAKLSREPSAAEVAECLGLRDARPRLAVLERLGLISPLIRLTKKQHQCLTAIVTLEERLGRSPSTREVSEEMGVAPSGSRFHIHRLVALGLVTPPEVRLVLGVTPAGRAYLPRAPLPNENGNGGPPSSSSKGRSEGDKG
jgi:DNA-binding MarR family transcriptional regulator